VGVLLVDDHDVVHVGVRVLLRRDRWVGRILTARTGADAVWLAARYEPAVALVDCFVGEELGTEVCRAIRENAPGVRVLLMSTSGSLTQYAALSASAAGWRRCARASRTPATSWTAHKPSTRPPSRWHVVKVPDGVESDAAAPLTCAGVTTYENTASLGASSTVVTVAVFIGASLLSALLRARRDLYVPAGRRSRRRAPRGSSRRCAGSGCPGG
jgi:CheY-like chemotaxis protein